MIRRYGEGGYYVVLGSELEPAGARATEAAALAVRAAFPHADVVAGGGVLAVFCVVTSPETQNAIDAALRQAATEQAPSQLHTIEVVYDGLDLPEIAARTGLSIAEIIRLHGERELDVELLGFLPGFGYLGPNDPRLVLPRRSAPRPRVVAGSLGIAGRHSGIYPFDSPGGWNLMGRAVAPRLFDAESATPLRFALGDRVRFFAVDAPPEAAPVRSIPVAPRGAALLVEAASPGVTVQDLGRLGALSRGLPPSGPLDPETFARANQALGNDPNAAVVEVPLGSLEIRARGSVLVSVDGAEPVRLSDGEPFLVRPGVGALRYLAVAGGVDVPAKMGARATLLVARLGGLSGRGLRRGDELGVGADAWQRADARMPAANASLAIEIEPGPHLERFPEQAFEQLLRGSFRVSALGDRVGQRLEGDRIVRHQPDAAWPVPMRRGAVQITSDGTPIVLGPDHPTTGGYPVLAVVRAGSWGALARLRPGQPVRFSLPSH